MCVAINKIDSIRIRKLEWIITTGLAFVSIWALLIIKSAYSLLTQQWNLSRIYGKEQSRAGVVDKHEETTSMPNMFLKSECEWVSVLVC